MENGKLPPSTRQAWHLLIALSLALSAIASGNAQTSGNDKGTPSKVTADKKASDQKAADQKAENERIAKERRASARSLLLSLASDARNFRDQSVRARSQARIADALWSVDAEQARNLFRKAWDAAEVGDKESRQRTQEDIRQQKARPGGGGVVWLAPPNLRGEVLRLAAKRDRALGEEFLEKLKESKQQDALEDSVSDKNSPLNTPEAIRQRLSLARQLLEGGDVARALQFADPVLGTVSTDALDFLSDLRGSDPLAADSRYATLVASAEANAQSDANTVSLLSSYLFTPHLFVTFSPDGGTSTSQMGRASGPPDVAPALRTSFLIAAAQILLRPLLPPEQDQTTSGRQGKYLVVKRLLPLFTQYAPRETAEVMRAQLDVLAALVPENARKRDDEWLNQGIGPEQKSEDREQSLLDRIEHAKTSEERDQLYLQLAILVAQKADFRARDLVDKIEESETRKSARGFIDMTLALQAIAQKDTEHALEISRIGELTHVQRVWVLTQAAKLLAKLPARTDREKSLALLDQAGEEVRRIDGSDPDRARGLLAIANAFLAIDPPRGWETTVEATKAANSAEGFTGEDGRLTIKLQSRGMNSIRTSSAEDFDVTGIFGALANENYERAVELARGFQGEAPRAVATIAIARAVLEQKPKALVDKK